MEPKEILRTIEYHLELEPTEPVVIKVDPEYLEDMGSEGAIVEMEGEPLTIYLKKKDDLETLAEELTHLADIRSNIKDDGHVKYGDCFYNGVLKEALGYYGSKLFIHERKPIKIKSEELKKLIEEIKVKSKLKKSKDECWEKLKNFYQGGLNLDRRTWHEIGYDLGEKVYQYVQKTGDKEPALLLVIKNRYKKRPFSVYKKILKQVTR